MGISHTSHWLTVSISNNKQDTVVNKAFIEQGLVYATSTLDIALTEACSSGQFGENWRFLWRAWKFHNSWMAKATYVRKQNICQLYENWHRSGSIIHESRPYNTCISSRVLKIQSTHKKVGSFHIIFSPSNTPNGKLSLFSNADQEMTLTVPNIALSWRSWY